MGGVTWPSSALRLTTRRQASADVYVTVTCVKRRARVAAATATPSKTRTKLVSGRASAHASVSGGLCAKKEGRTANGAQVACRVREDGLVMSPDGGGEVR